MTIEEIQLEAARRAKANVYTLNNRYLTDSEKIEVEMWFQAPGDLMLYSFAALSLLNSQKPLHWSVLVMVPIVVNLLAGLMNWFLYPRRLLSFLYLTILHNLVQWILLLPVAGFLFYNGHYWLAGAILLWKLGVLSIFEFHMVLFVFLSKPYGMHPKYAFLKREYGRKYPFEQSIVA